MSPACVAWSPEKPMLSAMRRTWSGRTPSTMSTGSVKMSSGVSAATSSIEVPPQGLATMTGPLCVRSIKIEKYASRRR